MCTFRFCLVLFVFALLPLRGQSVSFGIKAGVPLATPVEGSYGFNSAAKRYTLGPMVEIGLPFSFAFEANALYRRTGYDSFASNLGGNSAGRLRANAWEFPLLARYYLPPRLSPIRLYVSGGYVLRYTSGLDISVHTFGTDFFTGAPFDYTFRPTNTQYYVRDNPEHGFLVGAGARIRLGPLHGGPEVRYTRWRGQTFSESGSQGFFVQSTRNQVDLLLSITF